MGTEWMASKCTSAREHATLRPLRPLLTFGALMERSLLQQHWAGCERRLGAAAAARAREAQPAGDSNAPAAPKTPKAPTSFNWLALPAHEVARVRNYRREHPLRAEEEAEAAAERRAAGGGVGAGAGAAADGPGLDGEVWAEYTRVPNTEALADRIRACLQENEELPKDFTKLFNDALFRCAFPPVGPLSPSLSLSRRDSQPEAPRAPLSALFCPRAGSTRTSSPRRSRSTSSSA